MRHLPPALILLLAGCQRPDPATFEFAVRMAQIAPPEMELSLSNLSLGLAALRLRSCPDTPNERNFILGFSASERPRVLLPSAGPVTLPIGGRVLAARDSGFDVLVGPWCAMDVVLDGPLCLAGEVTATGATVQLGLQLPDLTFPDVARLGRIEDVENPGTNKAEKIIAPAILELAAGPWLDPILPALEAGEAVRVEPPDPETPTPQDALHNQLVARLLSGRGPALYRTADADEALTDEERAAAPLGLGVPAETTADPIDDACGFGESG